MKGALKRFRWLAIAAGAPCVPVITALFLLDHLPLVAALSLGVGGGGLASLGVVFYWLVNRRMLEALGFTW